MKQLIKTLLKRSGWALIRHEEFPLSDLSAEEQQIIVSSKPFTMTSVPRMAALLNSVNYIVKNRIPGDMCECGVWRGGSMMVVAKTLVHLGDTSRTLYLYDTFEGMSAPTAADETHKGKTAESILANTPKGSGYWCYAGLDEVRANLLSTGYPAEKIQFVKGKVEDTIPGTLPAPLSLLRLDTDWYESTLHELVHLYPLLNSRGVMVLDDYGYWKGTKKAVDEYFEKHGPVFLQLIDHAGRTVLKV